MTRWFAGATHRRMADSNVIRHRQKLTQSIRERIPHLSSEVRNAFQIVPRHLLLRDFHVYSLTGNAERVPYNSRRPSERQLELIYSDQALGTFLQRGRTISSTSQPSLVAGMLELLDVHVGQRVLEMGTGTGYNAALIAEIVHDQSLVVSVDILDSVTSLARRKLKEAGYGRIPILRRDGFVGAAEHGPFDRIVATVACPDLSPHWESQLTSDGCIVAPLLHAGWSPIVKIWRDGTRLRGKLSIGAGFVSMQGQLSKSDPWQHLGPRLPIELGDASVFAAPAKLLQEHLDVQRLWSSIFHTDFFLFLSIRSPKAFFSFRPPGYGLYDERVGVVLYTPGSQSLRVVGNPSLRDTFLRLFDDWYELGRPRISDYELEFRQHGQEPAANTRGVIANVVREYYVQTVFLHDK